MGTTMTLLDIVRKLDKIDKDCTIYATKPWTPNAQAMILSTDEPVPPEVEKLKLQYFLEIFIACDFLNDWATTVNRPLTSEQKCLRLIEYAINDA
jgi:hypothetical protein